MTENIANLRRLPLDRRIDPPSPEGDGDLREFALAARRQGWLVALCAILGLGLGVLHYTTSPKQYYASATVLIEERQSDLEQEISASLPLLRNETGLQNELQILRSLQVATEVVRALDLHRNEEFLSPQSSLAGQMKSRVLGWIKSLVPAGTDNGSAPAGAAAEDEERLILDAAAVLRARTTFARVGRSYSVEIGYYSPDPMLAAAIANTYADAYLADGMRTNLEASGRTAAWMRGRIEELRQAALDAAREAARFRAEHGATDQQGLQVREQQADALNDLFLTIQSRYQQITLEGSFPVSNGRILSRAVDPQRPALPKAWQILSAGLVAGMLLGLSLAVLRERREKGFRTGDDVRKSTGLAFLGYLPTFRRAELRPRKFAEGLKRAEVPTANFSSSRANHSEGMDVPFVLNRRPPETPGTGDLEKRYTLPPEFFVSAGAPGSPSDMVLRNMRATLDMGLDGKSGRVVAVGAILQAEGATTIAANLANLFARSGRRTLLIDGDFWRSDLSRRLGTAGDAGTLGVLSGTVAISHAVRRVPQTGLHFLPTGVPARSKGATDCTDPAGFSELIEALRPRYDLIIIDLPPLGMRPEAKELVRNFDRVVLVARWGKTPRRLVSAYLDQENEIRRRTAGIILNRTDHRKLPRYGVSHWRQSMLASAS